MRHRNHVVKHDQIGHEMIVADDLALLLPVILADHPLSTKGHPLHKAVPRFGDIGRGVDRPSQVFIVDKPTVSRGVTYAVVCTYGCDGGRISPTRCAVIDAALDGR